MNYFDTKPVGEVLSRVTNDNVDTLDRSLEPERHTDDQVGDDSDRSADHDADDPVMTR